MIAEHGHFAKEAIQFNRLSSRFHRNIRVKKMTTSASQNQTTSCKYWSVALSVIYSTLSSGVYILRLTYNPHQPKFKSHELMS